MSAENRSLEEHRRSLDRFMRKVAAERRRDPEARAALDADPRAFFAGRGLELPAGPDIQVSANTPEVLHLVIAQDPNAVLADRNLERVAGGAGPGGSGPGAIRIDGYTGIARWPGISTIPGA